MTTPSKITLEQTKETMRQYIREQTYRGPGGLLRHRACGRVLSVVRAYLSIHNSDFRGCTGAGRVEQINIPYCPLCEPEPEHVGCFHIPGESIPFLLIEPQS